MASLATPADLATRLNTTFDSGQAAQAQAVLDEASSLIRAILGQQLTQVANDVITMDAPAGRWLDLPQRPVTSISTVLIGSLAISDWRQVGDRLYRAGGWNRFRNGYWWPIFPNLDPPLVTVTYSHGLAVGDEKLNLAKGACCTLAMQAIVQPAGNVTMQSADEFRVMFKDDGATLEMTQRLEKALIKAYGRSTFTIDSGQRS